MTCSRVCGIDLFKPMFSHSFDSRNYEHINIDANEVSTQDSHDDEKLIIGRLIISIID